MKPNIIFILADDMGYGDVSCLNPNGKIPTPNIDRIAKEGIKFTDAHSSSAICSPSRYSVLTGRYCWRKMERGIVGVYGDPIIPPTRMTVANMLKAQGYDTACFGKWHLGMGWNKTGETDGKLPIIDFEKPVTGGPMSNGFDEYFGVDVPNWPPYCYLEGSRTIGIPYGTSPFGISNEEISIQGPCVDGWKLENILPDITGRACEYIHRKTKEDRPFFIYFPLTSPHTPLAVNDHWKGKSGLDNLYADFVMETDAMIGRVLAALDESGAAGNTLIMFASDNGCAPCVGIPELEAQGHFPSYIYRGRKFDAWDGGHRIPFVLRWPGTADAGREYPHLVSLADFFATAAEITGHETEDDAAEDSVSFLPIIKGREQPLREYLVSHSSNGRFAVRRGKWKLILCPGSGSGGAGDISPREAAERSELPFQLYDMETGPNERSNIYLQHPEIAAELRAELERIAGAGRSTPGKPQPNDLKSIDIDGIAEPIAFCEA